MGIKPNYHEAHLIVAAVRVLTHCGQRPPTPEDVAKLLGLTPEKTNIVVHELGELGVLRLLKSPFDVRLDAVDPRPLESLPREETDPAMKQELDEFAVKNREKNQEMERMLRGGEAERRRQERVAKLEEQFKTFKPKKGELESLFGGSKEGDDDE